MKKIRLINAHVSFYCLIVAEQDGENPIPDNLLIEALKKRLTSDDSPEDFIELKPFDFDFDAISDFDRVTYLEQGGTSSEEPTPWIQKFMEDYVRESDSDETTDWMWAIERFSTDLLVFEEAFNSPSDFPPVEAYETTEYEIMRFLIKNIDGESFGNSGSEERHRMNYYFLRYPKLRLAVIRYREHHGMG
jgi:hypothetical protein